jgi:RND family efflux transporter MFP subunit
MYLSMSDGQMTDPIQARHGRRRRSPLSAPPLPFAWCILIPVLAAPGHALQAQGGRPPSPVVVSRVVATQQAASKSFIGTLYPIRKSVVGSAVDGRVVTMHVDEGDAVSMRKPPGDGTAFDPSELGQPVVQLRTVSLDIEIEAAEVELRSREASEQELLQTLPTEIDSAKAAIEEIEARLKFSRDNYERLSMLAESGGGISRREIDESFSTMTAQRQLLIAARSRLSRLDLTRDSRLTQARAQVEAQQAEIRRLREMRDKYTIRAPFAGHVTSKRTELGQWVSRGEEVLEIAQLDPIELIINVPQSYIQQIQTSLRINRASGRKFLARVSVDDVAPLLEGEVVQIVPQADLRSRSFPVKIRIPNPNGEGGPLLKSGMLAEASLFIDRPETILLVKKDALVLGSQQISLYMVDEDPSAETALVRPVVVEVGAAIEDWIQVRGAIAEGDRVVVEGNERLMPGQAVMVARELEETVPQIPGAASRAAAGESPNQ